MSLYEQFHSDINKKFMFNMIKDIIHKESNFDISLDSEITLNSSQPLKKHSMRMMLKKLNK